MPTTIAFLDSPAILDIEDLTNEGQQDDHSSRPERLSRGVVKLQGNPIRLATTSLRLKQQNVGKNVVVHEEEV